MRDSLNITPQVQIDQFHTPLNVFCRREKEKKEIELRIFFVPQRLQISFCIVMIRIRWDWCVGVILQWEAWRRVNVEFMKAIKSAGGSIFILSYFERLNFAKLNLSWIEKFLNAFNFKKFVKFSNPHTELSFHWRNKSSTINLKSSSPLLKFLQFLKQSKSLKGHKATEIKKGKIYVRIGVEFYNGNISSVKDDIMNLNGNN